MTIAAGAVTTGDGSMAPSGSMAAGATAANGDTEPGAATLPGGVGATAGCRQDKRATRNRQSVNFLLLAQNDLHARLGPERNVLSRTIS